MSYKLAGNDWHGVCLWSDPMPMRPETAFGRETGKSEIEGKDAAHSNTERSRRMSQTFQQTLILVFLVLTTIAGMVSCLWMSA